MLVDYSYVQLSLPSLSCLFKPHTDENRVIQWWIVPCVNKLCTKKNLNSNELTVSMMRQKSNDPSKHENTYDNDDDTVSRPV